MAQVVFFLAAIGAIAGAGGTVALRNPFYAVLALVSHLVCLAALFLLLRAEFVAAAQVVVYAGAVMVLYVFVVAYVGGDQQSLAKASGPGLKAFGTLCAALLFVELSIAMLGSSVAVLDTKGTGFFSAFGTPREIGRLLLTKFLVAFELASILLLLAAVGAVVLARRRTGAELPGGAFSVAELVRGEDPPGYGGTSAPQALESQAEHAGVGATRSGGW